MLYITKSGKRFEAEPGVLIALNPNGTVTLHLGNGHTNNYINLEAFEDSLDKGYNLFIKPDMSKLMKELGL